MGKRLIKSVNAVNSKGVPVEIEFWGKEVTHRPISGHASTVVGSYELFLANGHSVNDLGGGRYEVVETDEILREV